MGLKQFVSRNGVVQLLIRINLSERCILQMKINCVVIRIRAENVTLKIKENTQKMLTQIKKRPQCSQRSRPRYKYPDIFFIYLEHLIIIRKNYDI